MVTDRANPAARVAHVQRLRAHWEHILASWLVRLFDHQAEAVVRRALATLPHPVAAPVKAEGEEVAGGLLTAQDTAPLRQLVITVLRAAAADVAEGEAAALGVPPLVATDPRLQQILTAAGQRVTAIDTVTRAAIQEVLTRGSAAHYSPYQIAEGVPADGFRGLRAVVRETYRNRAQTIARTEVAQASAAAASAVWDELGVQWVDIWDGPQCVMPGSVVVPGGTLRTVFRAQYAGPAYRITTADARQFTIGPNHPMLTRFGWVRGECLRPGDDLLYDRAMESMRFAEPHLNQMPGIEDVFGALLLAGALPARRRVRCRHEFHGDAKFYQGKVEIIATTRPLLAKLNAHWPEHFRELDLVRPDAELALITSLGGLPTLRLGLFSSPCSPMGSGHQMCTHFFGRATPLGLDSTGRRTELRDTRTTTPLFRLDTAGQAHERDAILPAVQAGVGTVTALRVVTGMEHYPAHLTCGGPRIRLLVDLAHVEVASVEVLRYRGWVYDVTTDSGAFTLNGIIAHNCGWTTHDDPDKANGSRRRLEAYQAQPLSHPNCRRVALPVLTGRAPALRR